MSQSTGTSTDIYYNPYGNNVSGSSSIPYAGISTTTTSTAIKTATTWVATASYTIPLGNFDYDSYDIIKKDSYRKRLNNYEETKGVKINPQDKTIIELLLKDTFIGFNTEHLYLISLKESYTITIKSVTNANCYSILLKEKNKTLFIENVILAGYKNLSLIPTINTFVKNRK